MGLQWNEGGFLEFNKQQTRLRWSLCKEALQSNRFVIELKSCYENKEEMLPFCKLEWNGHDQFDAIYASILGIGWRCSYEPYLKESAPEGSFFPFVRRKRRTKEVIDTGCIWLGSRGSYPRIKVDNRFCKWYFAMDFGGNIIHEPFLPFNELHRVRTMLNSEISIARFEGRSNDSPYWADEY